MIWLSYRLAVALHDEALAEHGGRGGFRDGGVLDAALARPQHLATYEDPDIYDLAASYAFGIVRGHPFIDGNKRTGWLCCELFLALNSVFVVHIENDEITVQVEALAADKISEKVFGEWLRSAVVGRSA